MFTRSTRRSMAALVVSVLTVAATSCTRDSPLEPDEPVAGSYELTAVAGQAVPLVVFQDANVTVEFLGGSLVLGANLAFTEILRFRETPAGGEPQSTDAQLTGTYSVSGRTVSFVSTEASWQGTASNGSLTYIYNNVTLLFEME